MDRPVGEVKSQRGKATFAMGEVVLRMGERQFQMGERHPRVGELYRAWGETVLLYFPTSTYSNRYLSGERYI